MAALSPEERDKRIVFETENGIASHGIEYTNACGRLNPVLTAKIRESAARLKQNAQALCEAISGKENEHDASRN